MKIIISCSHILLQHVVVNINVRFLNEAGSFLHLILVCSFASQFWKRIIKSIEESLLLLGITQQEFGFEMVGFSGASLSNIGKVRQRLILLYG